MCYALGRRHIHGRRSAPIRYTLNRKSISSLAARSFGNYLARLVFPEKTSEFSIEVDLIADMTVFKSFRFLSGRIRGKLPFTYPEQLAKELAPYLEIRDKGPLLQAF